jgi:hypothetical protein
MLHRGRGQIALLVQRSRREYAGADRGEGGVRSKNQESELIRLIQLLEDAGYRVKGIVEKSNVLKLYNITI